MKDLSIFDSIVMTDVEQKCVSLKSIALNFVNKLFFNLYL